VKALIDTHALIWWLQDSSRLPKKWREAIDDAANDIRVSAASLYEIRWKAAIEKLPQAPRIVAAVETVMRSGAMAVVAISGEHALTAGGLAPAHRDPFDRIIAAQSMVEGVEVVSKDKALSALGAKRVW
jgi:PIN domain nuclease of toxin-antitoxin system